MYPSFAKLVVLLSSYLLCLSSVAGLQYAAHFNGSLAPTLVRRVRIPVIGLPDVQTIEQIFNTGVPGDLGVCTAGQLAILNNWLSELLGLHEAAIATLFNAKKGDSGSMSIMSSIMGIKWMKDSPGVPTSDTKALLNNIDDRLGYVAEFLDGGGLQDPPAAGSPYLFCSDEFAIAVPSDQPAKDSNGDYVPNTNPSTQQSAPYEIVKDVFPGVFGGWISNETPQAFWVDQFNAYAFDGLGYTTLCGKPTVDGVTVNPGRVRSLFSSQDYNIVTGVFNPYTT